MQTASHAWQTPLSALRTCMHVRAACKPSLQGRSQVLAMQVPDELQPVLRLPRRDRALLFQWLQVQRHAQMMAALLAGHVRLCSTPLRSVLPWSALAEDDWLGGCAVDADAPCDADDELLNTALLRTAAAEASQAAGNVRRRASGQAAETAPLMAQHVHFGTEPLLGAHAASDEKLPPIRKRCGNDT